MKLIYIFLLIIVISETTINAQNLRTGNCHYMTFSVGYGINLTETKYHIPSPVISHEDNLYYSAKYAAFPLRKWGLYIETGLSVPRSKPNSPEFLFNNINQYVAGDIKGHRNRYTLDLNTGIMYRIENHYFCLLPHLGVGVTGSIGNDHTYILKEKGSNSLYYADYSPENSPVLFITPGIKFHFKIKKYLHLSLDVNYRQALNKIKIEYEKSDLYTSEVIEKKHWSKFTEQHINIKLGLCLAFGFTRD